MDYKQLGSIFLKVKEKFFFNLFMPNSLLCYISGDDNTDIIRDIRSRFWFTYRKNFPAIGK